MELTSVKHSPGVVIKNPSSPWRIVNRGSMKRSANTHLSCIWTDGGTWAKVALNFLGNNLLVDIKIRDPVPILFWKRRHLKRCIGQ